MYKSLKVPEDYCSSDTSEDSKWQGISDRVLVPIVEQFLSHVAR